MPVLQEVKEKHIWKGRTETTSNDTIYALIFHRAQPLEDTENVATGCCNCATVQFLPTGIALHDRTLFFMDSRSEH